MNVCILYVCMYVHMYVCIHVLCARINVSFRTDSYYYYYYIKYCAEINVIITHRKDYGNYLNLYKTESKWVS